jgi:parvulin-like peptidyl-prolyl isomerase
MGGALAAAADADRPAESAILARVGKGVITRDDLDAAIAGLPSEEQLMLRTPQLLREFVDVALIDQRLMADAARQAGMEREEPVRTALQQAGALGRDAVLAAAYREHRLAALPKLDDAALRKYYTTHAAEFSLPQRSRVVRLVFADRATAHAARAAARGGTEFEDLRERYGTAIRSFDTVWLHKPPQPSPLEDAIFRLSAGQVSDVLPLDSGFLLVKALDTVPSAVRPFEQVRDGIRARLETQRRDEIRSAVGRELRAAATVAVDEAAIAHYQWRGGPRP